MPNGNDVETESGSAKLRICVSEPEEISGPDQDASSESRDIGAAKARHPSQCSKP
jgi:hypothetical protein